MGMPSAMRRWTANDVRALPDTPGQRFEVVDGELLVSPSPSLNHQRILFRLGAALLSYLDKVGGYEVLPAPSDVELGDDTLVQPDLYVAPLERRPGAPGTGDPVLAIEVLSPSTAHHDRVLKRARYQRSGIECWIIDLDARLAERWPAGEDRPQVLTGEIEWKAPGATDAVVIHLPTLFSYLR